MNSVSDHPCKRVAALCKNYAQSPQGKEPEAPSTWLGRLARSLALIITLTSPIHAQLDTSGTGMSDVWERHFNRDNPGELFDPQNPDHAPHADPDGDGWTNLQESIAGTDPFSGKPPEGIVQVHVTYLKDQEEAPSPEYPEGRIIDLAVISWDTLPGKQYTLYFSPTLTAGSWLSADSAYEGDGTPAAASITLNDSEGITPDKLFWRVQIHDPHIDTDGDGLTDYEEFLLGSNPYNADTSGDGVPDGWLVVHGLHPTDHHAAIFFQGSNVSVPDAYALGVQAHPDASLQDFDGDGLTNEQENLLGTDPFTQDNPGILQAAIENGDFSSPPIGEGERSGVNGARWDYWPGDEVDGWQAIDGDHIEFQNLHPLESGNAYAELKAHPAGHSGLKQQVGTRKDARYLLLFDCRAHPHIAASESNFTVKISNDPLAEVEFDSNGTWEKRVFSFEAPEVISEIQFIPTPGNHAAMGGFIDNVRLRKIIVKDNTTATGVDDMSLEAHHEDVGYKPDYWIMAPQQGSPFVNDNLTLLKMEEIPNTNAQMVVSNADPNPEQFPLDGNFHEILWQGGNGDGVNDESRVKIKLNDDEEEHEVNVMVKTMKHRTVNAKVVRIRRKNGRQFPNPQQLDLDVLKQKVNEYLAYQLNAWVEFDVKDEEFDYETVSLAAVDHLPGAFELDYQKLMSETRFKKEAQHDIVILLLDDVDFYMSIEGHHILIEGTHLST